MAYYGNESGRLEVYVRPFPEVGSARWQVSTAGGSNPRWMPSGDEIIYQGLDGYLYGVRVRTAGGIAASRPERLFEVSAPTASRHWDVTPDGKRFMVLEDEGDRDFSPVVVVQNFFEELKARVAGTR